MTRRERPTSGPTPRLYQRAFDILARQIDEGVIPAGTRLQESGIAQQFGISRAPARRALAELAERGLLQKTAGRGYLVRRGAPRRRKSAPAAGALPADSSPGDALPGDVLPEAGLPGAGARLLSLATWERIYGEVENQIIARIAVASWRLNEAELARSYGVSRTVTRDVVGRLQQRGLLRKDDSARWYAPALTPEHVGELYELRWLLEPVALMKAAPRLPPGFLTRLRNHLEEAIVHAETIGGATLDNLEEELHVALLGHCGNRTLMQAITLHQSLLIAHRFLYRWTPQLFETEPFLPEHREILERLQQGKTRAAAESLEQHLRVSRERAIARIDVIRHELQPEELPYLQRLGTS